MQDGDFEKTMDGWAAHEIESAPEMQPTPEMYRMVQARGKRKAVPFAQPRWAMAGAALAGVLVVAILYVVLLQPSLPFGPRPSQELAYVGLREGFPSEKGVVIPATATPPDKGPEKGPTVPPSRGPKKAPVLLNKLMFQFQKQDSQVVEGIVLQAPPGETVALAPVDNYRLLLEPAEDSHVYVYQLTPAGVLVELYPNEVYSSFQNPLQKGQETYLPGEPNWFHLGTDRGQERLYIVASTKPIQELEDLYADYFQAEDEENKQDILSRLLDTLETIEETRPESAVRWVFEFEHR